MPQSLNVKLRQIGFSEITFYPNKLTRAASLEFFTLAALHLIKLFPGGIVCLVYIFCSAQDTLIRERAADVLSKMSSDKLMGPKVRIALSKFLPEIFLDAMRKSVEACLQMFEGSHENPELIWNEKTRVSLNHVVTRLAER